MKVTFVQQDKRDNKYAFSELKAGDIFTIADPKMSRSTCYMKIKPGKNYSSSNLDCVNIETGEISIFSDTKKEVISIDQLYVHKVQAELSVKVD
jgi:translation elongation factor P/translation initiation factor 5A